MKQKDYFKPKTLDQALAHIAQLESANMRLENMRESLETELAQLKKDYHNKASRRVKIERFNNERLPK